MMQGAEHERLMNPYSRLNQSMQNIRSTLYLANESRHPKTLLITSALPREGKTTFALWYASFCASTGKKVVLVDCDFERPNVHKMMDAANDAGLADVIAEDKELKSVVRTNPKTGLSFISVGRSQGNNAKLLDSNKIQDILDSLSWDYDLIVLDSAPVLALTDAHILAKLVDSTVFVLQWGRTRRELANAALRRLESIDVASVGGFILSQVSPKKSAGIIGYTPYTAREPDGVSGKIKRLLGARPGLDDGKLRPGAEA